MKVSLITVCYNSAAVIRTALESVRSQRGVDVEYLVVDGGSTDGTVEILRAFEADVRRDGRGDFSFAWVSERDRGMYDALNKGVAKATGEIVGWLNADDGLAADDVLARVAAAFDADASLDGTYGDIRFVRNLPEPTGSNAVEDLQALRVRSVLRYCSGRRFRPWQFRFGVQTAHPSTFFRRACFDRWGGYSLDYGMFGDFELLCRFIWRQRAKMRYLPICTTVMRAGGASTNGWRTTLKINATDRRALRDNGFWTAYPLLYARYLFKIFGFIFKPAVKDK